MNEVRLNTKLIGAISDVLFMPAAELMEKASIASTTWYRIMQEPSSITVQQMLAVANGMHIPLRRFFSTGKEDVIGRREEYVTEPYIPCRYDTHKMQDMVRESPDVTWQKAARATGMSYQRLRNSILGETRTPVTRLLAVCKAFAVDPFAVLVDPNPEQRPASRKQMRRETADDAMRKEIAAMREDVHCLQEEVRGLTEKYRSLLDDFERLSRRVSVSIDTVNNSYIGIASEATP